MTRENLDVELARYLRALVIAKSSEQNGNTGQHEELKTTPLFSWPVKLLFDSPSTSSSGSNSESDSDEPVQSEVFSQYAVLGSSNAATPDLLTESDVPSKPPLFPIFLNTNAPWSAFVCGSQGSGKSYTLSCMLENCLLPSKDIGSTPNPLSGLLFHYDTHSSGSLCEAAYLGTHLPVNVLCSPSNFYYMQSLYEKLPRTKGRVNVYPLLLSDRHLNTQRMMRLMAFNDNEVPLYMEVLIRILKEMAVERGGTAAFKYDDFIRRVNDETFSKANQQGPLQLRLQLLESFMQSGALAKKLPRSKVDIFDARAGCLTIVDLTDPFVDPASACVLFDICLALFLETRTGVGKVVALDEAHKFMDQSQASAIFTENLLSVIREQRHKGARVIIATQEPTISPKLLDLCSITIVHRFTSPQWLVALQRHLAAASVTGGQTREDLQLLFQKIVGLNVGESLLFSPSAMLNVLNSKAQKLGTKYLTFKTRPRITSDGGKSVMAGRAADSSLDGHTVSGVSLSSASKQ